MLHTVNMRILCMSIVMVWSNVGYGKDGVKNQQSNQLNKVYHHEMLCDASKNNSSELELGSLVCYFSQSPVINSLTNRNGADKKGKDLAFFFPQAVVSSAEAKRAIERINKENKTLYAIRFEEVKKPVPGIKLHLSFDADLVSMNYEMFDSIGQQKGIVFKFFNQKTLKNLAGKCCRPVLNLAQIKSPKSIAIDCGHGGKDTGTIGVFNYAEKQVTLNVGLELARLLKNEGFHVILTRDTDTEVALDERTRIANFKKADLFVSIHANNAANKHAQGVETFWMDPALLKTVSSEMDQAGTTIACAWQSEKCQESNKLACAIHKNLLQSLNARYTVSDRSVRKAVSQVLLGFKGPSVLVEVGYLSNPDEAKRLAQLEVQKVIAQGMCNGITSYSATVRA